MKEIKYKLDCCLCLTKCPAKKKDGNYTIRVGSGSCVDCEHCVSHDREKQIIVCNADKLKEK